MFLETSLLFDYTPKELGSVMYMDYEQLLQSKGMKMILVNYFTYIDDYCRFYYVCLFSSNYDALNKF